MLERNLTVTLEKAKEWYNNGNAALKEVALQAFSEKELKIPNFNFMEIKTFDDALRYFSKNSSTTYIKTRESIVNISCFSRASAAMIKLNIIRKVLNTNYDLHLTKYTNSEDYIWYPYLRFITKNSIYYNSELSDGTLTKIGKFESEGVTYDVLGGDANNNGDVGLGSFNHNYGVGFTPIYVGLLGCATKEIAKHLGKYFGMLILEAMYGDMVDFHK